MTNYLPYFFGLTSLCGGIYIFLYSFRIYKPKLKNQEEKERYADWFKKFGKFSKICSIYLILFGAYILIKRDSNMFIIPKKDEWTLEDRTYFIEGCLQENAEINQPEFTIEFCNCYADILMTVLTKSQFVEKFSDKTKEEKISELIPIIQDCLLELQQRLDSVNNQ